MEEELAEKLKDEEIPLTSAEKVRESEGAHQRTTGGIESNFQQLKFVDYESMSKTPLVASKKNWMLWARRIIYVAIPDLLRPSRSSWPRPSPRSKVGRPGTQPTFF